MCSRNRDYLDFTAHQRPMVGDTKTSALTVDHIGWLVCDGRLLDVSTWQFLFKAVGYSFGSNLSGTQFKLPDPAGRVVGFVGNNGSVDASGNPLTTRNMGSNVGNETHRLTIDQMPTHNHTGTTSNSLTGQSLTDNGHTHGYVQTPNNNHENATSLTTSANNSGVLAGTTASSTTGIILNDPQHNHTFTTNNTGGSNIHNNMQPTLFFGNLFIYSGKPFYANYPLTAGTNII